MWQRYLLQLQLQMMLLLPWLLLMLHRQPLRPLRMLRMLPSIH
jgi:hypothetical protein